MAWKKSEKNSNKQKAKKNLHNKNTVGQYFTTCIIDMQMSNRLMRTCAWQGRRFEKVALHRPVQCVTTYIMAPKDLMASQWDNATNWWKQRVAVEEEQQQQKQDRPDPYDFRWPLICFLLEFLTFFISFFYFILIIQYVFNHSFQNFILFFFQ